MGRSELPRSDLGVNIPTKMNNVAIATRVSYIPSHFSRRANEHVSGKFAPCVTRYTVLTQWGEQTFRVLSDAKKFAVIAKRSTTFVDALNAFIATE